MPNLQGVACHLHRRETKDMVSDTGNERVQEWSLSVSIVSRGLSE